MGVINIEGLGSISIKGETPTPEEEKQILNILSNLPASDSEIDAKAEKFVKSRPFVRGAIEIIGSVGGAALAVPFAGPLSLPIIAARSGMLALPFLKQLAKSTFGASLGGGTGAIAAQPFDPKDDIVKEIMRSSAEAAIGEGVGAPAGIKAFNFIASKLSPKIAKISQADDAEIIINTQKEIIKNNPSLYPEALVRDAGKAMITPALKTDNQLIDVSQNIAKSSLFGGKEINEAVAAGKAVANSALDDFTKALVEKGDPETVGRLFLDSLTDGKKIFKEEAKRRYDLLDEALLKFGNNKVVDVKNLNSAIDSALAGMPRGGKLTPKAKELLEQNKFNVDQITFKEANDTRKIILELGRDISDRAPKKYVEAQMLIADELTKAIDNAKVPQNFLNQYKATNQFYKDGISNYNDNIIEKILSKDLRTGAADAYGVIFPSKDKSELTKEILKYSEKIFGKDSPKYIQLKDSMKGGLLNDMLSKSSRFDEQYNTKIINGDSLKKYIEQTKKNTFKALFDDTELGKLNKLTRAIAVTSGKLSKEGGLPGGVFIQLAQAGAATGALSYGLSGGDIATAGLASGVTVLLGPKILSSLLVNPSFNKYLFEGVTAQSSSKAGAAFRQLVSKLAVDGDIPKDEANNAIEQSKKVETELNKLPIKEYFQAQRQIPQTDLRPINTQVTSGLNLLQPQRQEQQQLPIAPMPMSAPTPTGPSGGITSIPPERLQAAQLLFGRV